MSTSRSKRKVVPALRLLAALALAAPAGGLAAQAQHERPPSDKGPHTPHPEAVEAIDRLKSPYCPGFMLEVCPSPSAAALRDSLDMFAREGWPADSLVAWMLANHGDTLSALPERRGGSLIAWLVPPLAVGFGIAVVVLVLRRLRKPREEPLPDEVSDEERRRLDEALRELDTEEEPLF